jgi:hypothetical protein
MESAYFVVLVGFSSGVIGGLLAGFGLRWGSSRRCTRLEWAVSDIQQRLGSLHGQKASAKRWEKAATLEEEFKALQPIPAPRKRQYDNDPLGE